MYSMVYWNWSIFYNIFSETKEVVHIKATYATIQPKLEKKNTLKKFLIFSQKKVFLTFREIGLFYIFSEKVFSYISENVNFLYFLKKSFFLYFGK